VPAVRSDLQVLAAIADQMDVHLALPDAAAARAELAALAGPAARGSGPARRQAGQQIQPGDPGRIGHLGLAHPGPGQALLATWHNLLDAGRMQDGEPNLAGTARAAVARMSAATAEQAGTAGGGKLTVATGRGSVTVGVEIADMPDRVVWLPANSAGCAVRRDLGAGHGSLVTVRSAE
jgi:NADH-quinone oxidoreductase subunit G